MKILHIIPGLKNAGAEKNLFNLVTKDKKNLHTIVSLSGLGYYGKILREKNFKVYQINLKQNFKDFKKLYKLYKLISSENPDIVQTWMYYADVIGGLFAKFCGIKKIFWNLRSDGLNFKSEKLKIIPFYIIFNILSFTIPTKIIANSYNGIQKHKNFLNHQKFVYIANGYNIPKIKKKDKSRLFAIGHLGRFHPLKNHKMILNIAEKLHKKNINFNLYLGGKDINKKNNFFKKNLKNKNLSSKIYLLGEIKDTNKYYQNLDCLVSTSYSEGFPNVIAEAMSNGIICFATNVGMSKIILKESSKIFNNEEILVKKIIKLIKIKNNNYNYWLKLKKNCSNHIKNKFSVKKMIFNYNKVWLSN